MALRGPLRGSLRGPLRVTLRVMLRGQLRGPLRVTLRGPLRVMLRGPLPLKNHAKNLLKWSMRCSNDHATFQSGILDCKQNKSMRFTRFTNPLHDEADLERELEIEEIKGEMKQEYQNDNEERVYERDPN